MRNIQIQIFDFEDIYAKQSWHQQHRNHIKNLRLGISKGVNGYCSIDAQKKLKQACAAMHMPAITLLGSGNYHYLTYFLLRQIKQPFSLVLFDFHSDMQTCLSDSLLSCGNWVSFAIRDCPHLKQVFICGISEQYIPSTNAILSKSIHCFTEEMLHSHAWLSTFERLNRYPLYLSIDKDVFDTNLARTNWDQGSMTRDIMQLFFDLVFQKQEIVGGDICGECSVDYSDISYWENQKCNNNINNYLINCFMEHHQFYNKKKIC